MAYYQRVWAQIDNGIVQNRIVADDYETANEVTRLTYGSNAIAEEISQWRVDIGDIYRDGKFYYKDPETEEEIARDYIPDQEEEVAALKTENKTLRLAATFMAPSFTDTQALQVKELYPEWKEFIGKPLSQGERVLYEDKLYKVRQDVATVLENQPPSIDTAALYEEIAKDHEGTIDDPIPYNNNMELFAGKYYSQDGVIYHCTRDTGQAVYHPLSALVGIYVEVAS